MKRCETDLLCREELEGGTGIQFGVLVNGNTRLVGQGHSGKVGGKGTDRRKTEQKKETPSFLLEWNQKGVMREGVH